MRIARPYAACALMKKLLPVVIVVAACSVVPAQPRPRELKWSAETVIATPRLLRVPADSTARSALFLHPVSIRATARITAIADGGDDRILILDSIGNVTRAFASRGRGPGELLGVSHLTLRDNSILVGEAHNGRISEFTLGGAFVKTYPSPFAAGAVSATVDAILSASRSTDYYAARVLHGSLPVDVLRRPAADPADGNGRWNLLPGHDLIASDSSRTWVFDQGRGLICEYETPDSSPKCTALPQLLLDRLRRYRDDRVARLEHTIRMRVGAAPLAKDLLVAGPYLALLVPLPDVPVLLIDPTDGTLTPVMTLGAPFPDWAHSARSFAWDGRSFLFIGDDGFGRVDLTKLPSSSR